MLSRDKIVDILRSNNLNSCENFYIDKSIPLKKKVNAINAYKTDLIKPDDIIFLADDTVFGSASEGLIITEKFICAKELFCDGLIFLIDNIDNVSVRGSKILLNGEEIISFNIPDKSSVYKLFTAIEEIIENNKNSEFEIDNDDSEFEIDDEDLEESIKELKDVLRKDIEKHKNQFIENQNIYTKKSKKQIIPPATADGIIGGILNSCFANLYAAEKSLEEDDLERAEAFYNTALYLYNNKTSVINIYRDIFNIDDSYDDESEFTI